MDAVSERAFPRRTGPASSAVEPLPDPDEVAGTLPRWPFLLLYVGFPAFWLLGLGYFASALCAVPMLVLLWMRRTVHVPLAFGLWVVFVAWVVAAAFMVDDPSRLLGLGVRLVNYGAAAVLFVYVVNAERLRTTTVLWSLAFFFAFVVVGGYLGVIAPEVRLTTLTGRVLPGAIGANEYVRDLVNPRFAEVQQPWGAPEPFYRPSAPFPYTNSWGVNTALLVPVVIAAATTAGRRLRIVLVLLLAAALVPALATLNRGLFLALGFGIAWAAVRLAWRRRFRPLVVLLCTTAAGLAVGVLSGAVASLQERLEYSETNEGRLGIYGEAFRGTLESPLLGNGSPRPSTTYVISVGTQGQIWNVMFSYGFPALAFFLGWFAVVAWRSRRWTTDADLWLHVAAVLVLFTVFYYGYDGPQLTTALVVAALVMRPRRDGPSTADPPHHDALDTAARREQAS